MKYEVFTNTIKKTKIMRKKLLILLLCVPLIGLTQIYIGNDQTITINSKCYLLRPIIFDYKNNYIDVYHGWFLIMRKNYLVITGGAGFVGSNLIKKLLIQTKYKIISIDNYSSGSRKNHIKNSRVVYIKGHTKISGSY